MGKVNYPRDKTFPIHVVDRIQILCLNKSMENKEQTVVEKFYQDVADLLRVESSYAYDALTVGGSYRTRWNNRRPGNGRFEGFGLVRYFGPNLIHVAITNPVKVTRTFDGTEEFFCWLKNTIDTTPQTN